MHVGEDPRVMRRQGREGISRQKVKSRKKKVYYFGGTRWAAERKGSSGFTICGA